MKYTLSALILGTSSGKNNYTGSETANMKQMLDDMANYYVRGATYDDAYFNGNLTTCMKWLEDDILTES